ncbi:MerR family transcriptional regulator [uncultured Shewanella sp.]|uniref:MerR family transcriptional regulator n=1 Tax=uncultured Shewanella sp. TaxID=173975 RepID=UPI002638ADDA|nr:MerR family transcriptional regulator [uncultured Shewanella sp.]
MYIGEVARKTGLSIKAIRFYEEKGLIMPPRKGQYRVYNGSHIEVLNLIKEAKLLGTSLSQLKNVIVYKNDLPDWSKMRSFLLELNQQLAIQREALNAKVKRVEQCLAEIDSCPLTLP